MPREEQRSLGLGEVSVIDRFNWGLQGDWGGSGEGGLS